MRIPVIQVFNIELRQSKTNVYFLIFSVGKVFGLYDEINIFVNSEGPYE